MNIEDLIFIIYCFIMGCLWITFFGRYFYFAYRYENFLSSHYPDIAAKRKSDPLYSITWKAFPVFSNPSSESELKDESALELRRKARFSLIFALLILILSPLLGYVIRLLISN